MYWQQLIVGVAVMIAIVYAARSLGPRRWRKPVKRAAASGTGSDAGMVAGADAGTVATAAGCVTGSESADSGCGCGSDGGGCH
jgi:hypothetical protein